MSFENIFTIITKISITFIPNNLLKFEIRSFCSFFKIFLNSFSVNLYNFNTSVDNNLPIKSKMVDIIITSPPYGDSKTTVAYGQFSTLSNEWLGIKDARKLDKNLMGGISSHIESTGYKPLDSIISNISKEKPKRAEEIWSFYRDYKSSINNVSTLIKPKGIVAYVVGNRRVNDTELPTDEFTKYTFEKNGFNHLETIIRHIPNKRQPSKTSPSNRSGEKVSTMTNEYIVVLQKQA